MRTRWVPTTITSPPTTAPDGATLLTPNAVTRADPIAPWASSRVSDLSARARVSLANG